MNLEPGRFIDLTSAQSWSLSLHLSNINSRLQHDLERTVREGQSSVCDGNSVFTEHSWLVFTVAYSLLLVVIFNNCKRLMIRSEHINFRDATSSVFVCDSERCNISGQDSFSSNSRSFNFNFVDVQTLVSVYSDLERRLGNGAVEEGNFDDIITIIFRVIGSTVGQISVINKVCLNWVAIRSNDLNLNLPSSTLSSFGCINLKLSRTARLESNTGNTRSTSYNLRGLDGLGYKLQVNTNHDFS